MPEEELGRSNVFISRPHSAGGSTVEEASLIGRAGQNC